MKVWVNGTHHGVSARHLQACLNEYVFRFNRRFYPMTKAAREADLALYRARLLESARFLWETGARLPTRWCAPRMPTVMPTVIPIVNC